MHLDPDSIEDVIAKHDHAEMLMEQHPSIKDNIWELAGDWRLTSQTFPAEAQKLIKKLKVY